MDSGLSARDLVLQGNDLRRRGDLPAARAAYQAAVDMRPDPDWAVAACQLAETPGGAEDRADAKRLYELVISDGGPHAAKAAAGLGYVLRDEGDFAQAKAYFRLAAAAMDAEESPYALWGLGQILELEGDQPGALQAFRQAVDSLHPTWAPLAASDLSILLSRTGHEQAADDVFVCLNELGLY